MQVKTDVRGLEKVQSYMKDLPRGVVGVAMPAIAEYMLGDESHGYRHYPPLGGQKYLAKVPPSYVRTNDARNSWEIAGDKYNPKIVSKGVGYVQYIPRWKKYGWREWAQVAKDNMKGAIRHANAAVKKYLKSK